MTIYDLQTMKIVALHSQGLTMPRAATAASVTDMVQQLGAVQIDTLQMVQRSHYLVLWSRFGTYDTALFDRLMFDPQERQFFEYWLHAACIIPLKHYRYSLPRMRHYREGGHPAYDAWLKVLENQQAMEQVREHLRENGGARAAHFDYNGRKRDSWWDWKPAKRALELLYDYGEVMIADRVNFQRVYALREKVLPDWVDKTEPTPEEALRHRLELGALGLGAAQPMQLADYTHMKRTLAKPILQQMVADETLVEIKAKLHDGKKHTLLVHQSRLPLLQQAADRAITAEHTTFLSPFDSLFWARGRDMQFWNFQQTLEAYKPAPIRQWGYFCLPILHQDRLVGRFDPKLERKTGTLRLKALHLEPGISPDEELAADVAEALRDFMRFHDATTLLIEQSNPPAFAEQLMRLL